MTLSRARLFLPIGLAFSLAACSATPEQLAADLQKALEAGDMDAAQSLAVLDGSPADLRFFFLSMVEDCAAEKTTCSASIAPLDDEFRKDLAEQATKHIEPSAPPEGLVVVKSAEADGNGSGSMRMPYAIVDGKPKLVALRYSAAEIERLRGKGNDVLEQEFFAQGIRDDATGEMRTDWKEGATVLPADGGEPGKAILAQRAALVKAADSNDPDAAMNSGDGWARMVFADKDWDGKPVERRARELNLRAQAMRFLRDVTIERGYQRDDDVVLVFNARDGAGWIKRGVMMMTRDEGGWSPAGYHTVEYPAP